MRAEDKKLKSKSRKTKKGTERLYATPQTTLLNHPTRQKILEVLSSDSSKTTKDLEQQTSVNRMNLYHHLNLLEQEGLVETITKKREKYFQISSSPDQPAMLNLKVKVPEAAQKRKEFLELLTQTLQLADQIIPTINLQSLVSSEYKWLHLQFESET